MTKGGDIVSEFIRLLLEVAPDSFTEHQALDVERQIRRDYGGEQHYVAKATRPSHQSKAQAVRDFCTAGKPAEEAASRNGMSRATLYRLLGQKPVKGE